MILEFVVFVCQIVMAILMFGSMVVMEDASKDLLVMILLLSTYQCVTLNLEKYIIEACQINFNWR